METEELNGIYGALSPEERIAELMTDFERILFTSSFGSTSAYLIHLIHKINPKQKIYFLDTTYHFEETIAYKNKLIKQLNLNVENLKGDEFRNKFTRADETWKKDADLCCSINKVEPLENIKSNFQVWISGLMRSQTEHRSNLNFFEEQNGILKFYPIIDKTEGDAEKYILKNNLPVHPLKLQGYNSIGCTHCTTKGKSREGRWINKSKTECGLHL